MFFNLEEVKVGLREGKSYKRVYGYGCIASCEFLRPTSPGDFKHTVVTPEGSGSALELSMDVLDNDPPWPTDGYELVD